MFNYTKSAASSAVGYLWGSSSSTKNNSSNDAADDNNVETQKYRHHSTASLPDISNLNLEEKEKEIYNHSIMN